MTPLELQLYIESKGNLILSTCIVFGMVVRLFHFILRRVRKYRRCMVCKYVNVVYSTRNNVNLFHFVNVSGDGKITE